MAEDVVISLARGRVDAEEAARFAAPLLAQQADYISHGEVQAGRSPDGEGWAPDLETQLAEEFATALDSGALLIARGKTGEIAGVVFLVFQDDGGGLFGVIEDVVIAPERRGGGLGKRLVAAAEETARQRGALWLWLESGLRNRRAHDFFEKLGYTPRSQVFGKRLG